MDSAAGGTAIVRVAYDHAGVTVHSAHTPWLRGVLLLATAASLGPGLALPNAGWWLAATLPLGVGLALAALLFLQKRVQAQLVALLSFPMLILGFWVLVLAALAWGPWTPVLATLGLLEFGIAAWMIYSALWFPKERWIRLTASRLVSGTKTFASALRLEEIETLDVEHGLLILGMRDGRFERLGDGLPTSTLDWLANQVTDAALRRRETVTEDGAPPEPLRLLMEMAGRWR